MNSLDKSRLLKQLDLQPHPEGGYFRRSFQADHRPLTATSEGDRFTLTTIYYLLTDDSPTGHWHCNRSDIVHFYQLGDPVTYSMIREDGSLQQVVLGPDLAAGQQLQLSVEGGVWKASHLGAGEFSLVGEAVAPGFDMADMRLGERDSLLREFPRHANLIRAYSASPE